MRVLTLDTVPRRAIDEHGSRGFTVGGLGITADAHLVVVRLGRGGRIGRHPAAGRQLLLVVEGDASVAGADGVPQHLVPGQAAVWEPGEPHETRSTDGLVAFVVEGDLDVGSHVGAVDAP
ncbi:cupin domain-containing protein [Nocardioides sp. KIGAM211]|uniref:Cupin domain-containing protein n=1 Tax=Nocardioides luti TaxID=2761101 RepID=A0A7X0V8U8_9ACTN|nr:cupin domain-containing protein [Nocardioides luti]MBB6625916.1 cupin domain-containing protein [Nocardioides luti]